MSAHRLYSALTGSGQRMKYCALLAGLIFLAVPATAANKSKAPDGSTTYTCGDERGSAVGCFNYWVKSYSPDLPKADRTNDGIWVAASCSSSAAEGGLCYQGGVAWWYWSRGAIGDQELTGFTHRDYSVPGNDNRLGTAIQIKGREGCYGVAGRTFCMIRMNDL